MILEIATFDIKEDKITEFREVIEPAKEIIRQSKGFVSIEFRQCIEKPTQFLAFIQWQTLEDHTVGFRESTLFIEWRAILSPFFNSAPVALHYNFI
jgi:heme-degrading monooxygenase HmoA